MAHCYSTFDFRFNPALTTVLSAVAGLSELRGINIRIMKVTQHFLKGYTTHCKKKVLVDFAVLYVSDDAFAKLYVT